MPGRAIPSARLLLAAAAVSAGILAGAACTREVVKEVPVEVTVEVLREVPKEVPKEVPVEVTVEVPREVSVEVTREVPVEVTREVPVEVTREVPVEVTVVVENEVVEEVPMDLSALAEAIQTGGIDVGKEYGLAFGQRYHTIHTVELGLGCAVCHSASSDEAELIFIAQDVSPGAAAPVSKRSCLGCHGAAGPAESLYGPGGP